MIDRQALSTVARLLLFGALIIVIDFRMEGFDLLNDLIGSILVFIGVARLRTAAPEPSRFHPPLLVLAIVALAAAVAEQIDPDSVVTSSLAWSNVIGAWLTARLLASALAAENSDILAAQWSASERLLLLLGMVPIIGLSIIGWMLEPANIELGPLGMVILVLGAIPLLHLLVSLYRTSLLSPQVADEV